MSDPKEPDTALASEDTALAGEASKDETSAEARKDEASAEAPPAPDAAAAPKPKKKKRSKAASEEEAAPGAEAELAARPLDRQGRERPLFLTEFPEDPELLRLVTAFETGNYALIRSDAERLAERTEDPRVRDAALELRRRIDPDPLIKYLLGLAAALLLFLIFYAYHSH